MTEGQLDVVIVSYRCEALLRDCLTSLREHGAAAASIHVIDNASGDGTAEMVSAEFPEAEVTVNGENRGFAAAVNQGIAAGEAPFVLALNPDVELTGGVLDRLVEVMDEHPAVGICGPVLRRPDGELDHAASRSFPTPLSSLGHFTKLGKRGRAPAALRGYAAPTDTSGPVDAVNGALMLIRRSALEQVDPFDEGYWMYMEDLDLCYRMRQSGWLTWFEASVSAGHVKAGSTGPSRSLDLNYAFHYGMYRFYRKHYAGDRPKAVNAAVYLGIALKLGISILTSAVTRVLSRARRLEP